MNLFSISRKIIITCSNRLAPYLEQEVIALGYRPERVFKTGIELQGTMLDCIKLNMQLRCASQVYFSIFQCRATTPDELYRACLKLAWETWLPADGYFSITSNVNNLSINNPLFANVKLKDAIADRFRQEKGSRPNSGPLQDKTVIHLYWQDESVEIFADTSGETLSKHGYRKIPGKAPMLESLAAATLLATKWDKNSAFVNPMCGSGTVAIEAALLATHRKPGLLRSNYGFMHWLGYDASIYDAELALLKTQVISPKGLKIIASDISQDAVNIAMINADIAGVKEYIEFSRCDFAETIVPEGPGVVYFNPEYGDRLGDEIELQATYKRMGDFMKQKCQGYNGYIFTGNLELGKKIGLRPSRRIEFFTSKIDCRLFEYELYSGTRQTPKAEA